MVIQGEQTGAGLFVIFAECNGELLPEIVLMILGAGYGNASYGNQTVQAAPPQPEPLLPAPTRLTAPQIVSVSVSSLNRITIKMMGVDWQNIPEFPELLYSFRFSRNAELIEIWKTPDGPAHLEQNFFIGHPSITFDNAAEWSLTISGSYRDSEGHLVYGESSIAPLRQESSAVLSEFHFYADGGISWVFADWQNAKPIAVESRIDGGLWKLAYITDKTVSNAHSILHDMAFYQFYAGFDGQIHTVETRARIDGSADPWNYGETHSLILASEFTPTLVWNSHSFTRERGEFSVPLLMLSGRRDERFDAINAAFSMDGEPFIPIPYSPKTTETTTAFVELVRYLSASKKDGRYHSLIVKESFIRAGI
ncbi:MAG: hypothetical protein HC889_17095 [Synechococcaceae cyanobacterium SM1_2_3]|nr:hypothetical protein [Synechococcaceae cyanobacterium SM1_2_3]